MGCRHMYCEGRLYGCLVARFCGCGLTVLCAGFDISVGAYDSLDVAGFFKPHINGTCALMMVALNIRRSDRC